MITKKEPNEELINQPKEQKDTAMELWENLGNALVSFFKALWRFLTVLLKKISSFLQAKAEQIQQEEQEKEKQEKEKQEKEKISSTPKEKNL